METGITGRRLRIAVLVRRFISTGGAERYAVEVSRRVARAHEVHVFAQEFGAEAPSVVFHRVPRPLVKPRVVNQLFFSAAARRMAGSGFDIVHSYEMAADFDVMTVQSISFKGGLAERHARPGKRLSAVLDALSPRVIAYLQLERRQFEPAARRRWIAVSDFVREDIRRQYGVPGEKIPVVRTGVDAEDFRERSPAEISALRQSLGLERRDRVILFVGTEFRRKGLDFLLRAFGLMERAGVKLVVAGGGDIARYSRLAASLGIGDSVRFAGKAADTGAYYGMADVFVLPTLRDPNPLSPLEAMASGCPVVMSGPAFNGGAESAQNGEAVLLRDPRDPAEIASAVSGILGDEAGRRRLVEFGRRMVGGLGWDSSAEETISVYQELLTARQT